VGGAADPPAPAEVLTRAEPPDRAAGPPASAEPAGSDVAREPPGEAPPEREVESARLPYLDRRLAATETWLSSPVAGPYSIQLMHIGVDRGGGLEASLRQSGLEAQMDRVWVYRTRIRGESLLSVLLGEFASQEDARKAIEGLPARLQQARPFVRSVRDIRSSGLAQATPGGA
jgi:septal ring-binding cell division protein DamX